MPELPEVEAVCRRLRAEVVGSVISSATFTRPQILLPQGMDEVAQKVRGATLTGVRRRGKNILLDLDTGSTLHVHLRMTGNLYAIPDHRFRPVTGRAWFELTDGRALLFDDPRAIGRMRLYARGEEETALAGLGPEPLDPGFTPKCLIEMARRSKQPVKVFLLDQRRVSGLGNIYAAEALHEAGIHPARPIHRLSAARLTRLHGAIVGVLDRAVQSAWIAYSHPGRFQEAEWFPVQVYDREGQACGRCKRQIRRMEQGGRSTYFCAGCQK